MIHWKLYKRIKFAHVNKWYIQKPEPVQENETHKILYIYEIQTDHRIPASRPNLALINKKKRTYHQVTFAIPADHRVNKRKQKSGQIPWFCLRAENHSVIYIHFQTNTL